MADLKVAEAAVAAVVEQLNSGREVYQCAKEGQNVRWLGQVWALPELKIELQFLYEDQKPILETALDQHRKFAQQAQENIRENAKLKAQVDAELRLFPARLDAERHKVLRANFDHVVAGINQLASANQQFQSTSAALKLRTSRELMESEPANAPHAEPPAARPRNPDFENFLNSGSRN
jgi:hypothetical protein